MTGDYFDMAQLDQIQASMSAANFVQLLELFDQECGRRRAQFIGALAPLDRQVIAIGAHSVLGLAANMGAIAMADCARDLEAKAATASAEEIASAVGRLMELTERSQNVLVGLPAHHPDRRG